MEIRVNSEQAENSFSVILVSMTYKKSAFINVAASDALSGASSFDVLFKYLIIMNTFISAFNKILVFSEMSQLQ